MSNSSERVRDAIHSVAWTAAEMVRYLADTSAKIPHSDWTVGETATHIAMAQGFFGDLVLGESSPFDHLHSFAGLNAGFLEQFDERSGGKLAGWIEKETVKLLEVTEKRPLDELVNWHLGRQLPMAAYLSYCLYHAMAHSYDIAMALDLPNPIRPAHVNLTVPFFAAVAPMVVDPETTKNLKATVQLRIRGGPRMNLAFDHGTVVVDPEGKRRVDCYVSADPVSFFLVATKLTGQVPHILKGKLMTWGLRPWLGPRLPKYLRSP